MKTNRNIVLSLKVLTHIIGDFINVFVSLYFLQVSNGDLFKLVVYNIVLSTVIPLVLRLTGGLCKSKRKVWVLRCGMLMALIYFIIVLCVSERMPDYYILMGIIYGLKEGLYWGAFNILEFEGCENSERRKMGGMYLILKNVLSVIFSVTIGSVIYIKSFTAGITVMVLLVTIGFLLSMGYNDYKKENIGKFQPSIIFKETFKNKTLLYECVYHIFTGMIYSNGAFKLLVTVYILNLFNNSFTVGWVTALGSIASFLLGTLVIKVLNTGKKLSILNCMRSAAMILCTIMLILFPKPWVIVLFYFVFGVYKDIEVCIEGILVNNVANSFDIIKANKSEYSLVNDTWLLAGRLIGYGLLAGYAIYNSNLFIWLFIIPLVCICICYNILLKLVKVE